MVEKTLKALEFDKVLKNASEYCVLNKAKENFQAANPSGSYDESRLKLTESA